ncbi:hypothetical protein Tco_1093997 [Tanacetum coccineum]|uniref:Uncharacterized protein n=1 Tax=Tanacetum coccineum TaxID=301880 RepID=A0ABQ5IFN1_9ASTR
MTTSKQPSLIGMRSILKGWFSKIRVQPWITVLVPTSSAWGDGGRWRRLYSSSLACRLCHWFLLLSSGWPLFLDRRDDNGISFTQWKVSRLAILLFSVDSLARRLIACWKTPGMVKEKKNFVVISEKKLYNPKEMVDQDTLHPTITANERSLHKDGRGNTISSIRFWEDEATPSWREQSSPPVLRTAIKQIVLEGIKKG